MKIFALVLALGLTFSGLAQAEDEESAPRSVYYTITPAFVSNFGFGERKMSYVKAEVSIKLESQEQLEKLKQNEPLVRHEIVMLLSSQSKEDMQAQNAQENVRLAALSRVKEALAEEIGSTGVEDLLFTSFVIQI